ncbi:MAG: hypothetical protein U1E87_08985 [Alphaproteobacteria bacterium]
MRLCERVQHTDMRIGARAAAAKNERNRFAADCARKTLRVPFRAPAKQPCRADGLRPLAWLGGLRSALLEKHEIDEAKAACRAVLVGNEGERA